MNDIKTKPKSAAPRQRTAVQIPKEAMHRLWLRSKEKGRAEIEDATDRRQDGEYSEANRTGEKIAAALQSAGKGSAEVAIHKGRGLANLCSKVAAGRRRNLDNFISSTAGTFPPKRATRESTP